MTLARLNVLARLEPSGLALSPVHSAVLAIVFTAISAASVYSGLRGFLG